MKFLRIAPFLLFMFPAIGMSQGQNLEGKQKDFWSISIGGGSSHYFGDLVNPGDFGQAGLTVNVGGAYQLSPRFNLRSQLAYFKLSGDDKFADDDRVERNLNFFSNNWELNLTSSVFLFKIPEVGYVNRKDFNMFVNAGIGVMNINPKTTRANGRKQALQPLETENKKYKKMQMVVPVGLGAIIKVDPRFNFLLEGNYRFSFTDYMDDISSRNYVDPSLLKSDLSRELADRRRERDPDYPIQFGKRGNNSKRDGYIHITFSLQYTFGSVSTSSIN